MVDRWCEKDPPFGNKLQPNLQRRVRADDMSNKVQQTNPSLSDNDDMMSRNLGDDGPSLSNNNDMMCKNLEDGGPLLSRNDDVMPKNLGKSKPMKDSADRGQSERKTVTEDSLEKKVSEWTEDSPREQNISNRHTFRSSVILFSPRQP